MFKFKNAILGHSFIIFYYIHVQTLAENRRSNTYFCLISGFGFYPADFWQFFEGMPQSQEQILSQHHQ
jgi:hypothetical protein